MMMSMNEVIDIYKEMATIIDDSGIKIDKKLPVRYTSAINRLRYERDKSVGVKKKKQKKVHEVGELIYCGNCGYELTTSPHYKFCPNCGYRIID